jgi:MSHA biogenesis protein MshQ
MMTMSALDFRQTGSAGERGQATVLSRRGRPWVVFVLTFFGLWLASNAALATVYDFSSGNYPPCSDKTWYRNWNWTVFTCYGTVALASGDSIAPIASITIVADVSTTSSNITVSNTSIRGDITSSSGAIKLTNVPVAGSVSTNGTIDLTGGSVSGDVTGRNGVTTYDGTTIGGNVSAGTGDVSLSGGSVTGSVSSGKSVTTTKTDVGNGISSSSSTVSITGGKIQGSIATTGGSGIVIKDATVNVSSISAGTNPITISNSTVTVSGAISGGGTDGVTVTKSTVTASSITAGTNPVTISGSTVSGAISGGGGKGVVITDSTISSGSITAASGSPIKISGGTIGSSTSSVNISGNNVDSLLSNTTVYGNVDAGSWTGALVIDTSSRVYGTCTPDHPQCNSSAAACGLPTNWPSGLNVTCVCDSFPTTGANGLKNSSIFNSDWLISTSDATGILPRVVNKGYLRLTDNTNNNAKAATVPGIFPAAGNYISVEFRHYAYNSSTENSAGGGDGIAVTLSDYTVPPVPGAYGGSLGYAQKTSIHDGFSGGWIGIGLDEYGNYQNPTEGRRGGPGSRPQTVSVRGSGSGQSGYNWLSGTSALSPLIDNSASKKPSFGYTYQVIVDARNDPTQTAVTVNRDTGSGYASLVNIPNVYKRATDNGFTQSPVPLNWQISFTGSTGDATNIHEIGGLRICAQTVLPTTGGVAQIFSAIDEAYGTPSQTVQLDVQNYLTGHIYTKLVGEKFKLNVAALDDSQLVTTYAASSDKKVTVKLVDNSDALSDSSKDCAVASCSAACKAKPAVPGGTQTLTFAKGAKDKGQKQSGDFTINSAYQKLVAVISDDTTPTPASACSIDSFAVRPLSVASVSFGEGSTSPIPAGSSFSLKATTTGVDNNASLYTGVMQIDTTVLAPSGGATVKGTLAPAQFPAATSGTPSSSATTNFTYSEVGAFTLPGFDPSTDSSSARGVYDNSWTIVDYDRNVKTKRDCVPDSYSNVKDTSVIDKGKYGCNFGLANPAIISRFIPHHFDTAVVPSTGVPLAAGVPMACPTGLTCPALYNGIAYAGQPFTVNVYARNAADETTQNYDMSMGLSKTVTLSAWNALGGLVGNSNGTLNCTTVPAACDPAKPEVKSKFTKGTTEAAPATPNFAFGTVPTVPTDIYLRAVDTDAVTSSRGASSIEGGVKIVSGRVRVPNAYGSELLDLPIVATVQYFNAAGAWVTSTTDSLTSIVLAASYTLKKNGVTTSCTTTPAPASRVASAGLLPFVLKKPSCGTGSAKIEPTVPAYLPLLPGLATFGVYKTPLIYRREVY